MKSKINHILITILSTLLIGCTFYSFVDGNTKYPENKKINIKQFDNASGNGPPDLTVTLTEKTKDYYLQNGKFELADLNEDLLLECKVTAYKTGISGATSQETSAQSKLTITVSIKFTDILNEENNETLSFTRYELYDRNQDLNSVEADLVDAIAEQIITDIFNGTTMKSEW